MHFDSIQRWWKFIYFIPEGFLGFSDFDPIIVVPMFDLTLQIII